MIVGYSSRKMACWTALAMRASCASASPRGREVDQRVSVCPATGCAVHEMGEGRKERWDVAVGENASVRRAEEGSREQIETADARRRLYAESENAAPQSRAQGSFRKDKIEAVLRLTAVMASARGLAHRATSPLSTDMAPRRAHRLRTAPERQPQRPSATVWARRRHASVN